MLSTDEVSSSAPFGEDLPTSKFTLVELGVADPLDRIVASLRQCAAELSTMTPKADPALYKWASQKCEEAAQTVEAVQLKIRLGGAGGSTGL